MIPHHSAAADDDAYEIINGKKVLKDGARVHVTLIDAERARRRVRLTDAAGRSDPFAFSKPGYRLTADAGAYDERQAAYDAYLQELTTAWRRGAGKEDVVPDSPRASCNDAVPVPDIETAYRLYCEEISQAWKRPR